MRSDRSGESTQRLVFGVIILIVGVLFLLDNLNLIEVGSLGDYWPLIFVGIGVSKLLQSANARGRVMGAIFIAVGVWWTLSNLDLVEYEPLHYWPVILILVGASMLWRALESQSRGALAPPPPPPGQPPLDDAVVPPDGPVAPPVAATAAGGYASDSTVSAVAMFGGVERKCAARDFRGGSMTAILGACVIDLRQASIVSAEAVIDVVALWGGVEVRVPKDWLVVSKGMPLLGGFGDSTTPPPAPTGKVLVVRGVAIMGGVEIKN